MFPVFVVLHVHQKETDDNSEMNSEEAPNLCFDPRQRKLPVNRENRRQDDRSHICVQKVSLFD